MRKTPFGEEEEDNALNVKLDPFSWFLQIVPPGCFPLVWQKEEYLGYRTNHVFYSHVSLLPPPTPHSASLFLYKWWGVISNIYFTSIVLGFFPCRISAEIPSGWLRTKESLLVHVLVYCLRLSLDMTLYSFYLEHFYATLPPELDSSKWQTVKKTLGALTCKCGQHCV